jgi:hypothetical protein
MNADLWGMLAGRNPSGIAEGRTAAPSVGFMVTTAALFDQFRMHVRAAVAWERDLLRRAGLRLPSPQDGMFDDLMDELLARWPGETEERKAALRCDSIRWAKLHEPAEPALRWAA